MAAQLLIGGAIALAGTLLTLVAARRRDPQRPFLYGGVAICLLVIALLPPHLRHLLNYLPAMLLGLLVLVFTVKDRAYGDLLGVLLFSFLAGGIATGILLLVPGGVSSILLGCIALLALVGTIMALVDLVRARPAVSLVPNQTLSRVGVGGTLEAGEVAEPPAPVEGEVGWWCVVVDLVTFPCGDIRLATELGPILVEPEGATFDFDMNHTIYGQSSDKRELLDRVGASRADRERVLKLAEKKKDGRVSYEGSFTLLWLPAGATVQVIGQPEWEGVVAAMGGYRDTRWIPVFRAHGRRLHIIDRPEVEARRDARLDLVAGTLTTAASIGIMVAQQMGVA